MYRFKTLIFLALVTFLAASCRKDINEFILDSPGKEFTANILGIVVDEDGKPVVNAAVSYEGRQIATDDNGVYSFKNVKVNSRHNLVQIRKEGYFEGSRVFTTDRSTTVRVKNILLKKTFDRNFESNVAATVSKGDIRLEFPADGVVLASNNAPYSGTVQIAVKYLDPDTRAIFEQMPGNLVGINSENQIAAMTTYGMVAVEMQTPSGQLLQVAPGKKVKMINKLSSATLSKAPATIPLWYYDENLGYWKEEGSATLVNDGYVGEVSHFTYWNYDAQEPAIVLSGRVVDQYGNGVAGAHVWVSASGAYGAGHGDTNNDGSFSGLVTRDALLTIKVTLNSLGCNGNEIYSGQIGPFSGDATIPDIVVSLSSAQNLLLSGQVVDCNNAPVTNGYLKVTSSGNLLDIFEIENGTVSGSITTCNAYNDINVQAIDRGNAQSSTVLSYPVSASIDLGTIAACGTAADFVRVEIPDFTLDTLMFDDLNFRFSPGAIYQEIHAGHGADSSNVLATSLFWEVTNTSTVAPGTYNIFPYETNFNYWYNGGYQYLQGISGTITITQGGSQAGDVILGNYNVNTQVAGTVITHQVTGDFKLTLQ